LFCLRYCMTCSHAGQGLHREKATAADYPELACHCSCADSCRSRSGSGLHISSIQGCNNVIMYQHVGFCAHASRLCKRASISAVTISRHQSQQLLQNGIQPLRGSQSHGIHPSHMRHRLSGLSASLISSSTCWLTDSGVGDSGGWGCAALTLPLAAGDPLLPLLLLLLAASSPGTCHTARPSNFAMQCFNADTTYSRCAAAASRAAAASLSAAAASRADAPDVPPNI
jgi:hypothetical protein